MSSPWPSFCSHFHVAGDYISTKSQNEVIAADVKIEKEEHFVYHREAEEAQVRQQRVRLVPFSHVLPSTKCFRKFCKAYSSLARPQVRDFFSQTLEMEGDLLEAVVKDVTRDDDTLLTFMRKVRLRAHDGIRSACDH